MCLSIRQDSGIVITKFGSRLSQPYGLGGCNDGTRSSSGLAIPMAAKAGKRRSHAASAQGVAAGERILGMGARWGRCESGRGGDALEH